MARKLDEIAPILAGVATSGDIEHIRKLAESDLYFFGRYVCSRYDLQHQWLLDRCDEVEAAPNGYLDLWARAHYKSSLITFMMTLRDILVDPEQTVGIFSHTRPHAKQFLAQIKRELETNSLIRDDLYPYVMWAEPHREAPSWSLDSGIILKRKGNPKEATVEAWGIVDGQPTGKHFGLMIYDDVVTRDNAYTPDMRKKTLDAWELSLNLGTRHAIKRYIGTRYHHDDVYAEMISRGSVRERRRPAEIDGEPVLLTKDELTEKRRDMGPFTYAAQMMLDPKQQGSIGFVDEWLRFWDGNIAPGNRYLLVDPANDKKKKSDYTSMWVVELCYDKNYYVRDFLRDRLNLTERIDAVIKMHRKWKPKKVGYEQYGIQADIQALKWRQKEDGYRFDVVELGGPLGKSERIGKLIPLFEDGRIYLPYTLMYESKDEKLTIDMVSTFKHSEYLAWPYSSHDDMLDCLARIEDEDLEVVWPKERPKTDRYKDGRRSRRSKTGWMAN